ncbi:TPR domain protein [Nitzschia inconspicua]|uniref:ATP-dependent DNA helicase n=1 Tax=Nitzschia inconspicua TaxID=303405 RepID=A0A9K3LJL0_9STRA|nr:TPR domain protein [Nitzschia inconspicua]
MSSTSRSRNTGIRKRNQQEQGKKAECFAVAAGRKLGIFFTRDEMMQCTQNFPRRLVKSFVSVNEAQAFLREQGLVPTISSDGWLSTKKAPILYQQPSAASSQGGGSNITPNKREEKRPCPASNTSSSSDVASDSSDSSTPCLSQPVRSIVPIHSSPDDTPAKPADAALTTRPTKRMKRIQDIIDIHSDDDDEKTEYTKASSPTLDIGFDDIQQQAIDAAFEGKNVFITGVAGTGKSLVTQKIVNDARDMRKNVAVAAPTGVAAVNLGSDLAAQTVHSLAGCGVPQSARDFEKLMSRWSVKKWREIEMLILDEVGMLNADYLDWLDVYVRKARRRVLEVFGGIQLIFVGDFAQLGPIPGNISLKQSKPFHPKEEAADCLLNIKECAGYAFQTALWREADFHHVHLRTVYRQSNKDFVQALMDIREARPYTPLVKKLIDTCSSPLESRKDLEIPEGIKPTILYCTNRNVDRENNDNLAKLQTMAKDFHAIDSVHVDGSAVAGGSRDFIENNLRRSSFFNDCTASKVVTLKVGAQVMLLQNLDIKQGLVNGSRGVVESFKLVPIVIDNGKSGEKRRIGPNETDKFPGCRFEDLRYNQRLEFDGKIWRISSFEKHPFVRFANNVAQIITPTTFERNHFRQGKCIRTQIPLRLAWALTIHKSQGATLDYVTVDLKGCFTSGQAYVALSRARTMMGLQIKNFDPKHVQIDPLVSRFYEALDQGDMKNFLEQEAGIWWFPILDAPAWLNMFRNASNRKGKDNSEQFRAWENEYKPLEGYKGWGCSSKATSSTAPALTWAQL